MIVGATGTSDAAILTTAARLYTDHHLRRVYYSGFSPTPGPSRDLPAKPAPLVREHRLYQADWLIRYYGFAPAELTTNDEPNLDLSVDPKTAWAVRHPEAFPVDVQTASREQLLRVPGFGRKTVERLLAARRGRRIGLQELRALRVRLALARPFIVAHDWRARGAAAGASVGSGFDHAAANAEQAEPVQPLLWSA